jgi:N-acyl-D-amino-acid deacylase
LSVRNWPQEGQVVFVIVNSLEHDWLHTRFLYRAPERRATIWHTSVWRSQIELLLPSSAGRIGHMKYVAVVLSLLLVSLARSETPADPVKAAIEKGLRRLEQGAASYVKNRQCFSCHHQATTILALTSARKRGFEIEPAKLQQQVDFTIATFRHKREQVAKGQAVPGGNTMSAYALFALDAAGHAADETTAALVDYLLARQKPDGSWPAVTQRQPSEGSSFTNAALALRVLRQYGPAKDADGADERRARIDQAWTRGRDWLLKSQPSHTEDRAFRLRGLVTAEADAKEIADAKAALLKEQRDDGGWSQLADRSSDAYATGTVLLALRSAGLEASDPAYQKAVKYLLATQREDGAWIVETRSRPVQVFFDNGDPGGKSQFISFAATGWAVCALLETVPARR